MHVEELGHVVLYVTDLDRSVTFYRDILGFPLISGGGGFALFSGGRSHHELLLIEIGGYPEERRVLKPGLYHIGFKIGEGPEIVKEAYKELKEKGVEIIGATDHTVTHSLYILDPDKNELELYADISDIWRHDRNAIMAPPKPLNLD